MEKYPWKSDKENEHGYGQVYINGYPTFYRQSIIDLKNKIEKSKLEPIPVGDYEEVARACYDEVIDLIDQLLDGQKKLEQQ